MPIEHLSPQIALVIGAAAVIVLAAFTGRERQWWCAPAAAATVAVALVLQLDLVLGLRPQTTFDGLWALDGLTGWATVAILLVAGAVVGLSPRWMRTDPRHGEFYAFVLFTTLGATMLAGASDLLELVVALTLTTAAGYVLASYHRADDASTEAGMKFFLIGGLTNAAMLAGVALLYGVAGETAYEVIGPVLAGEGSAAVVAGFALVTVGLTLELGAVPAHAWMPDVAEGAPAPAAALLTTAPKLGALVALVRIVDLLGDGGVGWRPAVALLAAATMTIGNLAALTQDDLRRLLGWSGVSQSGYGLMAVVAFGRSDQAVPALLLFLFAYGVANVAAFGVVVHLRGRTRLADLAGVARQHPWAVVLLAVAFLSLVGIPPLAGFAAKLELFTATLDAGYAWLAVVAVANTVVSLVYYLRVLTPAVMDEPEGRVHVLGRLSLAVSGGAAAAVLAVGLAAGSLLDRFGAVVPVP